MRLLTVHDILRWADSHFQRTGIWPKRHSGKIHGAGRGETWQRIDSALRRGDRGLPGNDSLAHLLHRTRAVPHRHERAPLGVSMIVRWARQHVRLTGRWPQVTSGPVAGTGETWRRVDNALRLGLRGLPSGLSLADLLAQHCGVPNRLKPPALSIATILLWAEDHFRRTGTWPHTESGPVLAAPAETWAAVDWALKMEKRGLHGKSSLGRLLAERKGLRNHTSIPSLTVEQILAWADAYHDRHGCWPRHTSGAIAEALGETWAAVQSALRVGLRGLPGGCSLNRLINWHRLTPAPQLPIRGWKLRRKGRGPPAIRLEFPPELLAKVRQGKLPLWELARRCNVCSAVVCRELRRAGVIPPLQTPVPLTSKTWHRKAVELYRAGYSLGQIGKRFRRSREGVRLALIMGGVKRRRRGGDQRRGRQRCVTPGKAGGEHLGRDR